MIRKFKSNKFISLLLIIMCVNIMFNPSIYAKSCLNAISVWAFKILPLMFPFFIFTRLIVNLSSTKENFMDKFFKKAYHTPSGSFSTFFLSTLSGYPMGAKLICTKFENNQITKEDAKKMLSFCSVSGPMFMLGTVGIAILNSFKAGAIILISNIIASLLNGLIYRGKTTPTTPHFKYNSQNSANILSDSVYDSLISILMIGGYIVLSFIIIDLLNNLHITHFLSNVICCVFNIQNHHDVVASIINGSIEITRGILDLSSTKLSLSAKTIISSSLIGFGGLSVMLQNVNFLNKLNIPIKTIVKQKTTQFIFCLIVTIALCVIFL